VQTVFPEQVQGTAAILDAMGLQKVADLGSILEDADLFEDGLLGQVQIANSAKFVKARTLSGCD
jgi:hypothetical protein